MSSLLRLRLAPLGSQWRGIRRRCLVLFVITCAALSLNCGGSPPPPTIVGYPVSRTEQRISSLFVLSQVGIQGEVSASDFESAFARAVEKCDLRVKISSVSKLELDPHVHERAFDSFGASSLLSMKLVVVLDARYEHDLVITSATEDFWRGTLTYSEGERGEALARVLLNQLVADGIIEAKCYTMPPPPATSKKVR